MEYHDCHYSLETVIILWWWLSGDYDYFVTEFMDYHDCHYSLETVIILWWWLFSKDVHSWFNDCDFWKFVTILELSYDYLGLSLSLFMPENILDKSCHGSCAKEHYVINHTIIILLSVFRMSTWIRLFREAFAEASPSSWLILGSYAFSSLFFSFLSEFESAQYKGFYISFAASFNYSTARL